MSGLFIAIEGADGSGKGTHAALLAEYMKSELERDVFSISFPQYSKPSAYYASTYLNGGYGEANDVPADLASLAYAVDRFDAKEAIEDHLNKTNSVVIADRYVASNLAHQGTKFDNTNSKHAFYERTMQTEYNILGIPRPSVNIVLIMPTDIAQANVDKKAERSYTDKKRDIHEANQDHLEKAKANYEELCRLFPNEFTAISCVSEQGELRTIDDIQQEIRSLVSNL